MKITKASFIGIVLIAVSLGLIVYQATKSESSVTFYTPEEIYADLKEFEGKLFRVSGLVVQGTKLWDGKSSLLQFQMTDLKGHDFYVDYRGIPPDLFKEGQGVIVEGYLEPLSSHNETLSSRGLTAGSRHIQADLLLVKHSEVYDTKQDHSRMRQAKLLESILKDQSHPKRSQNP